MFYQCKRFPLLRSLLRGLPCTSEGNLGSEQMETQTQIELATAKHVKMYFDLQMHKYERLANADCRAFQALTINAASAAIKKELGTRPAPAV